MKVKDIKGSDNVTRVSFKCPGCGWMHKLARPSEITQEHKWTFNEDYDKPTFKPSILYKLHVEPVEICHSFVTDGRIQFLNDCTHKLAGQTVELPEIE